MRCDARRGTISPGAALNAKLGLKPRFHHLVFRFLIVFYYVDNRQTNTMHHVTSRDSLVASGRQIIIQWHRPPTRPCSSSGDSPPPPRHHQSGPDQIPDIPTVRGSDVGRDPRRPLRNGAARGVDACDEAMEEEEEKQNRRIEEGSGGGGVSRRGGRRRRISRGRGSQRWMSVRQVFGWTERCFVGVCGVGGMGEQGRGDGNGGTGRRGRRSRMRPQSTYECVSVDDFQGLVAK